MSARTPVGTLQTLGILVSAGVYLGALYCLPATMTVFTREARLAAAFAVGDGA